MRIDTLASIAPASNNSRMLDVTDVVKSIVGSSKLGARSAENFPKSPGSDAMNPCLATPISVWQKDVSKNLLRLSPICLPPWHCLHGWPIAWPHRSSGQTKTDFRRTDYFINLTCHKWQVFYIAWALTLWGRNIEILISILKHHQQFLICIKKWNWRLILLIFFLIWKFKLLKIPYSWDFTFWLILII